MFLAAVLSDPDLRVPAGKCFCLYPEDRQLPADTRPHIVESDITSTVLFLRRMEIAGLRHCAFMDRPGEVFSWRDEINTEDVFVAVCFVLTDNQMNLGFSRSDLFCSSRQELFFFWCLFYWGAVSRASAELTAPVLQASFLELTCFHVLLFPPDLFTPTNTTHTHTHSEPPISWLEHYHSGGVWESLCSIVTLIQKHGCCENRERKSNLYHERLFILHSDARQMLLTIIKF